MDVIVINNVEIPLLTQGRNILVPIKPLCKVLGIDHSAQIQSIKTHSVLSENVTKCPSRSSDGKRYQMICLPSKYIFGWLISIDARKVKPESSQTVIKYQKQIYNMLYDRFYSVPIMTGAFV